MSKAKGRTILDKKARLSISNVFLINMSSFTFVLRSLEVKSLQSCESSLEGKLTKKTFLLKGNKGSDKLELIYFGLCGKWVFSQDVTLSILRFSQKVTDDMNIYFLCFLTFVVVIDSNYLIKIKGTSCEVFFIRLRVLGKH